MALQFILGNSGSGKTEYIYRKVVEEAQANPLQNYLVIVPEQFTLQTQKMLVQLSKNKAIMNIDVLSFKRMAYRIFDELGIRELDVLDETGKNLVLRKVAEEEKEKLSVLRSNMNRIGYINEVKSLLSEFVQYNISEEDLHEYLMDERLSDVLVSKLKDVEVMYHGYNSFMRNRFTTSEEILNLLLIHVSESEILKGCTLIFDEFTGFTPIQNRLLSELFKVASMVYLTLTIDGKEDMLHSQGMHELFDMPKKTISSVYRIARGTHQEILEPIVFDNAANRRFKHSSDLAFLEKNLFRKTYTRKREVPADISIISVNNPKDELVYVARMINNLIQKKDYRYQDIAIITGDVATYSNYIENIFAKYHIPVYLDETRDIVFHPFIEFIKATLEVVEKNFSYESVFRFLRTGFSGMEEKEIDLLENYVLATGTAGRKMYSNRFLRTAKRSSFDMEQMERLRIEFYGIFEHLLSEFDRKDVTVRDRIIALTRMMQQLKVDEQLQKRGDELLEEGNEAKAKEYSQIYKIVMQIFEKYVGLLGEEQMPLTEFREILSSGVDAAKVATIPPGQDCVTLGDIERTRLNKVRVLFLLGVNDGIIPKAGERGGIISAYEREALKELDIELAPGAREQSFIQRYYLYLNLTKPSELMYITYHRADMEGENSRPSYLINTIKRMFPALVGQEVENIDEILNTSTPEAALEYLVHGKRDEDWYRVARFFMEKEQTKQEVCSFVEASYEHYEEVTISKLVARAIYGDEIHGSVTRLEKFAKCAYMHFLQYGVHIKEREEAEFSNMEIGNLYHDAIYLYSRKLEADDSDWFTVSDEHRMELAKEAFCEASLPYSYVTEEKKFSHSFHVEQMEQIFQRTIWALTQQVRAGRFVPTGFEVDFNEADDMQSLHYELQERLEMNLTGRIDRVDTCRDEGKLYVKIIDYKSGIESYDLLQIYQGTQLQLLVYMNAVLENEAKKNENLQVEPGAVFYYHIDNPHIEWAKGLTEKDVEDALLKKLMPDGPVNSNEEVYRLMDENMENDSLVIPVKRKKDGSFTKNSSVLSKEEFGIVSDFVSMKVKQMGQDIYDGVISTKPTEDACTFCSYQSICKIQSKLPGYEVQASQKLEKEEVLDKMNTELAKNAR